MAEDFSQFKEVEDFSQFKEVEDFSQFKEATSNQGKDASIQGAYDGWESDARGYGAEIGTSDVGYAMRILKSKFPKVFAGNRYDTTNLEETEVNGKQGYNTSFGFVSKDVVEKTNKRYDDFQTLDSEDERREYLKQQNIDDANKNYPKLTDEMKESGQALVGEIGGSLLSPTTIMAGPAALLSKSDKLYKAGAKFGALSGLWAGEYSALQQKADTGKIDPIKTGRDVGIGTVGGVALRTAAPVAYKGVKSGLNKTNEAINKLVLKDKTELTAVDFMEELNTQAAQIIRNNGGKDYFNNPKVFNKSGVINEKELRKVIKEDLANKSGRTLDEIKVMEREAGIQFKIPKNQSEAIDDIAKVRFDKYTNPDKNPFKYKVLQGLSSGIVKAGRGVEDLITPSYEKLKQIAPELAAKMMRMDFNILTKANRLDADVKKFVQQTSSLNATQKTQLKKELSNGNFSEAIKILGDDVGFSNVRKVLERLRNEAIKTGIKIDKVENYFPRYVKNHQSYLDRVNAKLRSQNSKQELKEIDSVLADLNKKTQKNFKRNATDIEKANEINKFMQGQTKRKTSRVMQRIDESLIDEYLDPVEALERYMLTSINQTEKAKFLGKYARLGSEDGNEYLQDSIGAMAETFGLGTRTKEVQKILNARLITGEQGSGIMQVPKNITYMAMLANPSSAIVQAGDVGFSIAQNGMFRSVKNLMKQMGRQKFGDKLKYNIDEIGLGRNVSAEISENKKGLDKAVDKLFNLSQFTRVDRVGKTTSINSAIEKATDVIKLNKQGKLANPKQYQQFKNEWQGILGEDGFNNLVAALRTGRKTDDVGFYLFSELSKIQPISLSQMPVGYLQAKNGKILYTLKSFGLKQLDFARRKILTNIGRGEYGEAFKNTLVLSAALGGTQTTTDQLKKLLVGSPEEITIDNIPSEFAENLMNIVFLSKYSTDRLGKSKDVQQFLYDIISPPIDPTFNLVRDILDYVDEPDTVDEMIDEAINPPVPFKRSRKNIPLVGRIIDEQTVKKPKRQEEELRQLMRGLDL